MMMRWMAAALIVALVAGPASAAIRCGDAVSKVLPCQGFIMSGATAPSVECCSGVQSLDKMATESGDDRRAMCRCFKGLSRSFPVNLSKAQLIPQLCNVTIHIAVTPNIDCDRI